MGDETHTLVARAERGDRAALARLLERNLDWLHAFVRLKAGRRILAKESCSDLVQSVCREVLEDLNHHRYQGEGPFRQWLANTAMHKIIDRDRYWRASCRDPDQEVSASVKSRLLGCYRTFCTPSQGARCAEEISRIERAFAALPEDYREVILLARIMDLSQDAIAKQMGRSIASVRNLLHRALARLSGMLVERAD